MYRLVHDAFYFQLDSFRSDAPFTPATAASLSSAHSVFSFEGGRVPVAREDASMGAKAEVQGAAQQQRKRSKKRSLRGAKGATAAVAAVVDGKAKEPGATGVGIDTQPPT